MSRPRRELRYEYDNERKEKLGILIKIAIGDKTTQEDFAGSLNIRSETLNRYINAAYQKNSQSPPSPMMLKKISDLSCGRVSYEALLNAAGYDETKYKDLIVGTPNIEILVNTIERALLLKQIYVKKDYVISDDDLFFLEIVIDHSRSNNYDQDLLLWEFIFLDKDSTISSITVGDNSKIYQYYGQLACANLRTRIKKISNSLDLQNIKTSFVTTREEIYSGLKSNDVKPYAFPYLMSSILLNSEGTKILKEDFLETENPHFKSHTGVKKLLIAPE